MECADGSKCWHKNGVLHNLEGPAVTYPNGTIHYFINGNNMDEFEFREAVERIKNPDKYFHEKITNKIIEIDGVRYKLVPV
jgi:hypothetical protein